MIRRFEFHRDEDVSGASGTGVVVEGVEFSDGSVAIRWLGERPSTVMWENVTDAIAIHGHGGKTRLVWLDWLASGQVRGPGDEPRQSDYVLVPGPEHNEMMKGAVQLPLWGDE